MIISSGRNYIFVHIPKTGGTSLAQALEARAMKDDVLIGDTPKALRRRKRLAGAKAAGRVWKHSTLADVDGLISLAQVQRAFAFTLVRNPWDRLVSYYHWLHEQSFDHPAVALARARDFSGFLNARHTIRSLHAQPYAHYMTACDGREYCNAYLRLEHFAADAAPLWDHLGFVLDLPHANRSTRARDYTRYYSNADRALVQGLSASDIGRFGYRFG